MIVVSPSSYLTIDVISGTATLPLELSSGFLMLSAAAAQGMVYQIDQNDVGFVLLSDPAYDLQLKMLYLHNPNVGSIGVALSYVQTSPSSSTSILCNHVIGAGGSLQYLANGEWKILT